MFTIGEFSKIAGLSVKTIRFYHEKQILTPSVVDDSSGYRYYDHAKIEKARIIKHFRDMEFSISEIKQILETCDDQADILDYLRRHKQNIEAKMKKYKNIAITLDNIISNETEVITVMKNSTFQVEEETLDSILIAGIRMKGKYSDCGKAFAQIGKALGRYIAGKPFCLYYDNEYKPDDADFEPCFPIRKPKKEIPGISIRQLPPGQCLSLLHQGPYDKLGPSYEKILGHAKNKGYEIIMPTREIYLKGPGMIFKSNPKKYLTKIQLPIKKT